MKKTTAIFLEPVLILLLVGCYAEHNNPMTVVNRSTQEIATLTVEVCAKRYNFSNIPTNSSRLTNYDVTGDNGYYVTGSYKDGRSISNRFGYITKQIAPVPVTIEIGNNGVVDWKHK